MEKCITKMALIAQTSGIAVVVLSGAMYSGPAFATDGDVFARGTVYNAATYFSHPSKYGHKDEKNVVDINVGDGSADCNLPLVAPESGGAVVILNRHRLGAAGWGNAIEWKKGGERLFLAHLARFGKTGNVDAGDVIGYVGTTGNSSNCHLHIEAAGGHLVLSGRRIIPSVSEGRDNGYAYTSNGPKHEPKLEVFDLWRKKNPIYASRRNGVNNFDAQFKIRNNSARPQVVDDAAIAVIKDRTFLFDCWKLGGKETIASGSVFHTGARSCEIYNPGSYQVAARLKVNGVWREYERVPFKVYDRSDQGETISSCDATKKATADRVFKYVESKYRAWFPPGGTTYRYVASGIPTYWRYYSATRSYLWIWKDGHLWYKIGSGNWGKSNPVNDWCKAASKGR